MTLPNRLVGEADVVAVALRHLLHAVSALEQGQREAHLRLHSHLLHELATRQQVEQLVGAAQLDIGFDDDRVVGLHERVEEFVQADGLAVGVALVEVVALEDAGHREVAGQLQQVLHVERKQPLGVVAQGGLLGVEDLERLVDVGLGVRLDLLGRELRTRGVATRRIADERGAVADDERHAVAEILELAQLAQRHGMAEMDIGSSGIDAQLDVERRAPLELLEQRALRHDLRCAGSDGVQLFFRGKHGLLFLSIHVAHDSTIGSKEEPCERRARHRDERSRRISHGISCQRFSCRRTGSFDSLRSLRMAGWEGSFGMAGRA